MNAVVVIAVPWSRVPDAVQGLDWNGRIVIDATNDFDGTGFAVIDLGALSTGGAMQQVRGPLSGVNLIRLPDR